eukprot:scaffold67774_cov23-Cyclotella_meneghiniana.AAC.1
MHWRCGGQTLRPLTVEITTEVKRDLEALVSFYESEDPVFLPVQPQQSNDLAYYMGGDASSGAYGTGVQTPDGKGIVWLGNWRPGETARESNWREAANLARILLMMIRAGTTWYGPNKGMSRRKGLTDLVREIELECRKHQVFWHPFHVSGKRMIKMGFDGLSQGDFDSVIMMGIDIRTLVPLGIPAVDEFEDNQILEWLKSWMGKDFLPSLSVN